jgi:citronellol/citronellal dehydrogenase
MGRLDGKVAIVTGASRGLGEYCALGFAREGAKVVIAARSTETKDPGLPGTIYSTARLIEEAGGEALPVICNVADAESIESMAEQVIDHWGRIDILMNNAAIQPPGGNVDILPKHWELQFRVNVHGTYHCIHSVLPTMLKQGSGNIINISSAGADWLQPTPYGTSKRAVEALTAGFANELKEKGVVVNSLKPTAIIETPGYLYAQVPRKEGEVDANEFPPPDSYVEAATLLALQTTETFTGRVHNDAELIGYLADDATKLKFRDLNPASWTSVMDGVTAKGEN